MALNISKHDNATFPLVKRMVKTAVVNKMMMFVGMMMKIELTMVIMITWRRILMMMMTMMMMETWPAFSATQAAQLFTVELTSGGWVGKNTSVDGSYDYQSGGWVGGQTSLSFTFIGRFIWLSKWGLGWRKYIIEFKIIGASHHHHHPYHHPYHRRYKHDYQVGR